MDEAFVRDAIRQRSRRLEGREDAFPVAPHFENGMGDKLRHKVEVAKAPKHGVEQKRHVVVDDVDDEQTPSRP